MKKKFLSMLLALSMLFAFMPVIAVSATSGTCGDNVTWTLDDNGTLTISGTGDMTDYNYFSSPFYNNSNIKSVIIENGVTSIGNYAFRSCSSLISVTIPDSVTSIGDYAFYDCIGLTSVTIGNGVTTIGENAFSFCSGLTSVTIPNSVTSIGDSAFRDCNSLTSVTIPDSVTTIGNSAFQYCTGLTSIYISDLAAYLNINFGNYSSNPMLYANKLYLNNKRVVNITIPDSVTQIPNYAFSGCDSLTSVTIPDSVTTIGDYAFYDCIGLTSVTIPDSVTTIGEGAFRCANLDSVYISDLAAYLNINGESPMRYAKKLYLNNKRVVNITIPDSVTQIPNYAFSGCDSLTSVTIPDSVTTIGDYAFYDCIGLTSVTIPDSVTTIGEGAFRICSSLTSVTIPDSVTTIGDGAFQSCSGLTSVTIGNGITNIGSNIFVHCSSLEKIIIPKSVTEIEKDAFADCCSIKTVEYEGSKEEWDSIYIGSGNDYLKNAEINFNYKTTPTPTAKPTTEPTAEPTPNDDYPYIINELSLNSTSGNKLNSVPTDTGFIVNTKFTKVQQRTETDYIFVAVYATNGALLSLDYVQAGFAENYTYNVGFYIPPQKENIGTIKAFVWNAFNSMVPLAESKAL